MINKYKIIGKKLSAIGQVVLNNNYKIKRIFTLKKYCLSGVTEFGCNSS